MWALLVSCMNAALEVFISTISVKLFAFYASTVTLGTIIDVYTVPWSYTFGIYTVGCEFFRHYKVNGHVASRMQYDWNQVRGRLTLFCDGEGDYMYFSTHHSTTYSLFEAIQE